MAIEPFFSAPHGNQTFFFGTPWESNFFWHPMGIQLFFLAPHGNPTPFFSTPWESNIFFFSHPMRIQHFLPLAPHGNPTFVLFAPHVLFSSILFFALHGNPFLLLVFSTPWSNAMAVGPRRRRLGRSAGVGADCQAQVAGASRWDSKPEGNKCDKPMLGFPMCPG